MFKYTLDTLNCPKSPYRAYKIAGIDNEDGLFYGGVNIKEYGNSVYLEFFGSKPALLLKA